MRKQTAIALSICLVLPTLIMTAVGQQPTSLVTTVHGTGTIKVGKEEFKLEAVVVKLFEDGKAEMHLVTDMTVLIQGTWARRSDTSRELDVKITGSVVSENMAGGGKLFLSEDHKSVTGLKLEVLNKTSKKVVKVDFVAK